MKKSPYEILLPILLSILFSHSGLDAAGLTEIHTSAGVNSAALREKSMSPLQYAGSGLSAWLALGHESPEMHTFFRFSFERGTLINRYDKQVLRTSAAIKNYNFYPGGKRRSEGFFAGWANINSFVFNDFLDYSNFKDRLSYYTAFGPALQYRGYFRFLGLQFRVSVPADMQMIGFYQRPSYISDSSDGYLDPELSGFMAWLHSLGVFFPVRCWNLAVEPELSLILNSGNRITLAYHYDFLRINLPEPLVQSKGNWSLSLVTRL